jgi:hypothetical protein
MSSGHVADIVDEPQMTQCMVRPRVARGFVDLSVLHQCIRPHIAAVVLRAIMNISARGFSLPARPQVGHLGHQGSHAPGSPVLHLVSLRTCRRVGSGSNGPRIAVGMPIAGHPPHRSGQARFGHPALTLGV